MSEKLWRIRENQNGSSELMHYGILGMKWGVRRTPEQLGHRKGRNLSGKPLKYTSEGRETVKDLLKFIGKIAVSMGASSLAPVVGPIGPIVGGSAGLYFLAKSEADTNKYTYTFKYSKGVEKLSKLKRKPKDKELSMADDAKKVNKTGKMGYVKNCFNCVCALEMRRKGYDVEALPTNDLASETDYIEMFDGVKLNKSAVYRKVGQSRKDWVMEGYDSLCKDIEKNPEGSRGFVGFLYEGSNSGHTISWAVEDGQAIFYDPQAGKRGADGVLSLSSQYYWWGRLDNCEPTEKITQSVGSKGMKHDRIL